MTGVWPGIIRMSCQPRCISNEKYTYKDLLVVGGGGGGGENYTVSVCKPFLLDVVICRDAAGYKLAVHTKVFTHAAIFAFYA